MTLKLYNTLTRSKDEFKPIESGKVRLYTCGPTVYNYAHIGNLRTYVFEDILKRALWAADYEVNHVMNVTDVGHLVSDADEGEDKMALGAKREGKSAAEIADFYWAAFRSDIEKLNIIEPDIWCKATDHIGEQIDMIRTLEEKGFTYTIADGVYFDTSKLDDYGKLARLDIAGLQAGQRVEMAAGKRNITDFALWKFSPKDEQRLMEWSSPWGVGFPGWHIECSAMAMKYLGEQLDIHCGGVDHVNVHHTNEIAQAESAIGGKKKWVNWWMHGEFLVMPKTGGADGGKMSKSSGEFLTVDVLAEKGYDPLAYRYFLLGAHYRQQLTFTWDALDAAASAYGRLKAHVLLIKKQVKEVLRVTTINNEEIEKKYAPNKEPESVYNAFMSAVMNDLNMPQALAVLWPYVTEFLEENPCVTYATLLKMDKILGLGIDKMESALTLSEEEIEKLIEQRNEARKNKNFARSDEIRDGLLDKGVKLEDSPDGKTSWVEAV